MALESYDALKAEITRHLGDRDDDVTAFIRVAESRHERDIRIREMLFRENLTIASRYVALPDGFLEPVKLVVLTNPVVPLSYVSPDQLDSLRVEASRAPMYYTVHNQFEFDSAPTVSVDAELLYYKRLSPLVDTQQSNALLLRAPDAYLYAALSASAPYLMNDDRVLMWERLYGQARDSLNASSRSSRYAQRLTSRVAGPTP